MPLRSADLNAFLGVKDHCEEQVFTALK